MTYVHTVLEELAQQYADTAFDATASQVSGSGAHPSPLLANAAANLARYAAATALAAETGYRAAHAAHPAAKAAFCLSHGLHRNATAAEVAAAAVHRALAPFNFPSPSLADAELADSSGDGSGDSSVSASGGEPSSLERQAAIRAALNTILATLHRATLHRATLRHTRDT